MKKRTIFIGDIHGCYDEFKLLINKLNLTKDDEVFLVGDMINKGPKSWKVIKYLYKNRHQFKAILGNHELFFLEWLEGGDTPCNNQFFYRLKDKFLSHPEIFNYFKELNLFIERDDFILLHGGLDSDKAIEDHTAHEITRIREINNKPWYEQYQGDKKVIYGHWAMNGLNIYKNTIGIDGGCVYGRALHAYILETGDIVTQQALKLYKDVFIKED